MSELEVIADGRRFVFPTSATVRIGRAPDADVVMPLATVGRYHCHLAFADEQWTLFDDQSRNGTWVGDERITSVAIAGPTTLRLGAPAGGGELVLRPAPTRAEAPGPGNEAPLEATPGTSDLRTLAPDGNVPLPGGPPVWGPPPLGPAGPPSPPAGPGPVQAGPPTPPPGDAAPAQPPVVPGGPLMPPAMRGGGETFGTVMAGNQPGAPVLVARLGSQQYLFPVGTAARIGRDPSLEMVSSNPLVSRNYHAVLTSDMEGATFTDVSSRGSYLDGTRIAEPLRITESVVIRLGDPATGEELGVTPPLSVDVIERHRHRREALMRRRRGIGIVALVAVVVIAAGVTAKLATGGSAHTSLTVARQATVLLEQGTPQDAPGSGSGTVLSPDGLILTNGHVAEPRAAGEAVSVGEPGQQLEANPPFLTVAVYSGESSPVVPKYRARVVAVDGYLDLAVVKIYATSSGAPVNPSSLHLPYLRVGDVAKLHLDQHVRVLGFPGVSQSSSLTVTDGVVSTFVPDPLGHVHDNRFELETTARVAHGNSGGAAIDDNGDLIGVPSLSIPGEGGDVSWRLRAVTQAVPLIDAARAGRPYTSHLLVGTTGHEGLDGIGIGATATAACNGSQSAPSGLDHLAFGFSVTSVPANLDLAMLVVEPDGSLVQDVHGAIPETTFPSPGGSGCNTITIPAGLMNAPTWPDGSYQVQLLIGPNLDPLGPGVRVSVGSSNGSASSQAGSGT